MSLLLWSKYVSCYAFINVFQCVQVLNEFLGYIGQFIFSLMMTAFVNLSFHTVTFKIVFF